MTHKVGRTIARIKLWVDAINTHEAVPVKTRSDACRYDIQYEHCTFVIRRFMTWRTCQVDGVITRRGEHLHVPTDIARGTIDECMRYVAARARCAVLDVKASDVMSPKGRCAVPKDVEAGDFVESVYKLAVWPEDAPRLVMQRMHQDESIHTVTCHRSPPSSIWEVRGRSVDYDEKTIIVIGGDVVTKRDGVVILRDTYPFHYPDPRQP